MIIDTSEEPWLVSYYTPCGRYGGVVAEVLDPKSVNPGLRLLVYAFGANGLRLILDEIDRIKG